MDEIVQMVADRAGIPKEVAQRAVEVVLNVLRERLPEPMAGQLDAVISGTGGLDAGSLAQGLGGLFGKH